MRCISWSWVVLALGCGGLPTGPSPAAQDGGSNPASGPFASSNGDASSLTAPTSSHTVSSAAGTSAAVQGLSRAASSRGGSTVAGSSNTGASSGASAASVATSSYARTSSSLLNSSTGGDGQVRHTLSVCWRDPACRHALVVSHGGDWNLAAPYGSLAALERAAQGGAHAVKVDSLVTVDGVPMAAHSSPIQIYESLDCAGKTIESMTAAQVGGCHLLGSSETIQRIDALLQWSQGKVIMELDTKDATAVGPTVTAVLAQGAQDRVYLQVDVEDVQTLIPTLPGAQQVWFMPRIRDTAQVDLLIHTVHNPQVFMLELDRSYPNLTEPQMGTLITQRLHPAGLRAFTKSDQNLPTVQNHVDIFNQGFDVVLSYNIANGLHATQQVDAARGLPPWP